MSERDDHRCQECGRPTSGGGLCPVCLLRLGLDETGAEHPTAGAPEGDDRGPLPEVLGPYRIERLLGEGGMGRVYLARQERPVRRTVALKVIKPGIDSRETLARFEAERRSLELMDHPSIARVLDAGETGDGRPYFVMEYVDGRPITAFADERRLSTEERVRLLIRVCDAVQHAHAKGVIHRDLKPTNVLVAETDDEPRPIVIDFGIAKATGERLLEWTHHTELGRLIGTPEYMSPEQADTSRRDVDTRTDVYALGVLLYELLVGRPPHDARAIREAGLEEMLRRIREADLPTPSARLSTLGDDASAVAAGRATDPSRLLRQVRGELDWITMRALERDRERRYGSSAALADDLRRFLADEPVQARAPTAAYRAWKFVRRHRLGVGIAAAALLTLVAFAGTMTWQAGIIARERDRARLEAASSERVASLMVDLFRSADPYARVGDEPSARDVLEAGIARLSSDDSVAPELRARMLAETGWALDGLGDHDRALEVLEQAVALYRERLGPADERTLHAMHYLAVVLGRAERLDASERLFREIVATLAATRGPDDRRTLRERLDLTELWLDAGMNDRAIPELEALLADQRAALGESDPDTVVTRLYLGVALAHASRTDEATPHVDAALAALDEAGVRSGTEARDGPLMRLGWACLILGRTEDGERIYRRVLELREQRLGGDHAQTLRVRAMLASVLDVRQRPLEAAEQYRSILESRRRVLGAEHPETLQTHALLAGELIDAGRHEDAEALLRDALAVYERSGETGFWPARMNYGLARTLALRGRCREALAPFDVMLAYCDEEAGDRHPLCRVTLEGLARCLETLGDGAAAGRLRDRLAAVDDD